MKTIQELWDFLSGVRLDNKPLPDSLKRDIQSFSLEGIKATPELGNAGRMESASIAPRMQAGEGTLSGVAGRKVFRFGAASIAEQKGVHPKLIAVANLAITLSTQDFCFYDGVRSYKEQVALKAAGKSKTMMSKHLIQPSGYGEAMDLVPWIGGQPVWDWDGCYKIAYAVDLAATQLGVANKITWGAAWDRRLSDFGSDLGSYEQEVRLYRERHPGPDFIDGPHFQWQD